MPVTERLMAAGQWSLKLSPDTPKGTRDLIDFFGHVFVFDSIIRPGLSDATMIAASRWGGIVRRRQTPFDVEGVNMIAWLGDEDGKGPLMETSLSSTLHTFANYLNDILSATFWSGGGTPSVTVGTTSGSGAQTATLAYQWVTPRAAIDHLCSIFAKEYRVNKNATIDTDDIGGSVLFKTTPVGVAMRRSSGRDLSIVGIPVTQLDVSIDSEEYFARCVVKDASSVYTASTFDTNTIYKDLHGNLIRMTKLVNSSLTPTALALALADSTRDAGRVLRNEVKLGSDEFDLPRDVNPGDNLWVFDPESNMVDTANQVRYRGSVLSPIMVRVLGSTWPIERGLDVWYRSRDAGWTNLTPYVLFESAGAALEVGAKSRALLTTP